MPLAGALGRALETGVAAGRRGTADNNRPYRQAEII